MLESGLATGEMYDVMLLDDLNKFNTITISVKQTK